MQLRFSQCKMDTYRYNSQTNVNYISIDRSPTDRETDWTSAVPRPASSPYAHCPRELLDAFSSGWESHVPVVSRESRMRLSAFSTTQSSRTFTSGLAKALRAELNPNRNKNEVRNRPIWGGGHKAVDFDLSLSLYMRLCVKKVP